MIQIFILGTTTVLRATMSRRKEKGNYTKEKYRTKSLLDRVSPEITELGIPTRRKGSGQGLSRVKVLIGGIGSTCEHTNLGKRYVSR